MPSASLTDTRAHGTTAAGSDEGEDHENQTGETASRLPRAWISDSGTDGLTESGRLDLERCLLALTLLRPLRVADSISQLRVPLGVTIFLDDLSKSEAGPRRGLVSTLGIVGELMLPRRRLGWSDAPRTYDRWQMKSVRS